MSQDIETTENELNTREHRDTLREIGTLFLAFGVITSTFLGYGIVSSCSMEPTLMTDEQLLLFSPLCYNIRLPFVGFVCETNQPKRGDIVLFEQEVDKECLLCKRIIGLAGDEIVISGNNVYVNDVNIRLEENTRLKANPEGGMRFFKEELINEADKMEYTVQDTAGPLLLLNATQVWKVPENHVFVLGDNRQRSVDSREFGCVPKTSLKGKVIFHANIGGFTRKKDF